MIRPRFVPTLTIALGLVLGIVCIAGIAGAQPIAEGPEVDGPSFLILGSRTAAFRPNGDLLLFVPGSSWDSESCVRRWAPCAGNPLQASVADRVAPVLTTRSDIGETLNEPRLFTDARAAAGPAGDLLAVWQDEPWLNIRVQQFFGGDGSGAGIAARLFDSSLTPKGPVFRINESTQGPQDAPAVARNPAGGFVVAWESQPVQGGPWLVIARRFDPTAAPQEDEITVSGGTDGDQRTPVVAHRTGGGFLVVWQRTGAVGGSGIFSRAFNAAGQPLAAETRIDEGVASAGVDPALTVLPGGGFAAVWRLPQGTVSALRARRLDSLGHPVGAALQVNQRAVDSSDAVDPGRPSVAADAHGNFLIVWSNLSKTSGQPRRIYSTFFDATGKALARETVLSTRIDLPAEAPFVVSDGGSAYAVTWQVPAPNVPLPGWRYRTRRFNIHGTPCTPSPDRLCLDGGRFRVEARWRDDRRNGLTGTAGAVPYSKTTGEMWFFDRSNPELLVKMLDSRAINGHFWFFYGVLTDVELWLRAADTATGRVGLYHKDSGKLCGASDLNTFTATSANRTAACVPGATTLCLLQGRYAVNVSWRVNGFRTGNGKPVPQSDAEGAFWFMDAANLDLAVKMIDGTALNGKIWLFYGAATDIDYILTVTETATGVHKSYHHVPGNFCGGADTAAF